MLSNLALKGSTTRRERFLVDEQADTGIYDIGERQDTRVEPHPELMAQAFSLSEEQADLMRQLGADRRKIARLTRTVNTHFKCLEIAHRRANDHQDRIGGLEEQADDAKVAIAALSTASVNARHDINALYREAASNADVQELSARVSATEAEQTFILKSFGAFLVAAGSAGLIYTIISFLHLI